MSARPAAGATGRQDALLLECVEEVAGDAARSVAEGQVPAPGEDAGLFPGPQDGLRLLAEHLIAENDRGLDALCQELV